MKTFEELGVSDELLLAISEMGFEMPMPVQAKVIPHLLKEDNDKEKSQRLFIKLLIKRLKNEIGIHEIESPAPPISNWMPDFE